MSRDKHVTFRYTMEGEPAAGAPPGEGRIGEEGIGERRRIGEEGRGGDYRGGGVI